LFKKKTKISQGFLIGLLIYCVFVGFLYFRMKRAEENLADYMDAKPCLTSANCREIIKANVLDFGSNKMSYTNYGPKGMPLESGTFQDYRFLISIRTSDERTIKILPDTPEDINGFDIGRIYIPQKSDSVISNSSFLEGRDIYIEIWRDNITFVLLDPSSNKDDEREATTGQGTTYIVPIRQKTYEMALPTEKHPLILYEFSKTDFNGWGIGVLYLIVSTSVVGIIFAGLIHGLDWGINKIGKMWRKDDRKKN
jgi:hypothetical protein